MPKHSRKRKRSECESDEDAYIEKQMRKFKKKIRRHRRKRTRSSSSSDSSSTKDYRTDTGGKVDDPYDLLLEDESSSHDDLVNETLNAIASAPAQGTNLPSTSSANNNDAFQISGQNTTPEQPSTASIQPTTCDVAEDDKEPELDQDLLELLGETPTKDKKYGRHIKNELAVRWSHILTTGLTKDTRKELLEKYLVPENCKSIDPPILNPEAKAAISEVLIKKDKAIEYKQKKIAAAISSLGEVITQLFDRGFKEPTIIKPLLDAARLVCDVQHTESLMRRRFICSTLKKDFKDQLYETEIDKYLFGDKLADTLKAAKAIQKSGTDMKIPQRNFTRKQNPTGNLNSKAPLPNNSRSAGVSRKQEPAAETNPRQPTTSQKTSAAAPPSRSRRRSQMRYQRRR